MMISHRLAIMEKDSIIRGEARKLVLLFRQIDEFLLGPLCTVVTLMTNDRAFSRW